MVFVVDVTSHYRSISAGSRIGRPVAARSAAFAAAPGPQFTVFGATPTRDSAVVGFSAATKMAERTSLFVSYDGELGGGTDNHQLRAGFRMSW